MGLSPGVNGWKCLEARCFRKYECGLVRVIRRFAPMFLESVSEVRTSNVVSVLFRHLNDVVRCVLGPLAEGRVLLNMFDELLRVFFRHGSPIFPVVSCRGFVTKPIRQARE